MTEDKIFEIYYLIEQKKESESPLDRQCGDELEKLLKLASVDYLYQMIKKNHLDSVLRTYLPPSKQLSKENKADDASWEDSKLTVRDKLYVEFAWNVFYKFMKKNYNYTQKKIQRIFFRDITEDLYDKEKIEDISANKSSNPYHPYYSIITDLPKNDYYDFLTAVGKWTYFDIYADDDDNTDDDDDRLPKYRLDKLHLESLHSAMNDFRELYYTNSYTRRECLTNLFTEDFLDLLLYNLRLSMNGDENATINVIFWTAHIRKSLTYNISAFKKRIKTVRILQIPVHENFESIERYINNVKIMVDNYFELKKHLDEIVDSI